LLFVLKTSTRTKRNTSRTVTSRTVTSHTVTSRTVTSRTVTSRTVTSRIVTSRTVTSRTVMSRTVTSRTVTYPIPLCAYLLDCTHYAHILSYCTYYAYILSYCTHDAHIYWIVLIMRTKTKCIEKINIVNTMTTIVPIAWSKKRLYKKRVGFLFCLFVLFGF